jgi:PAS domain S-box-containing protein
LTLDTGHKQAEQSWKVQQQFFSALLENMAAGVVACNEKEEFILINRVAREWHGLEALPIPLAKWSGRQDLYLEDGVTPMDKNKTPLARAIKGETVQNMGMVIAAKGHSKYHILANTAPVKGSDGHILGAVVVMHDTTENKRAEEEIRKEKEFSNKLEEEAHKRLQELEVFYQASIGREERILELKKKVAQLEEKLKSQ